MPHHKDLRKSYLRNGLRQPSLPYRNWRSMKRVHFLNRQWTTKSWCSSSQTTLCPINHQLLLLILFLTKRANILAQEIRIQYRWYPRTKGCNRIRLYRRRETAREIFIHLVWAVELNQRCAWVRMVQRSDIANQAMTARWLPFAVTLRHRCQTTR